MRANEDRRRSERMGSVSLILPKTPGSTLTGHAVAEYRRLLEEDGGFHSVEVVISSSRDEAFSNGQLKASYSGDNGIRLPGDPCLGGSRRLAGAGPGGIGGGRPASISSSWM